MRATLRATPRKEQEAAPEASGVLHTSRGAEAGQHRPGAT